MFRQRWRISSRGRRALAFPDFVERGDGVGGGRKHRLRDVLAEFLFFTRAKHAGNPQRAVEVGSAFDFVEFRGFAERRYVGCEQRPVQRRRARRAGARDAAMNLQMPARHARS